MSAPPVAKRPLVEGGAGGGAREMGGGIVRVGEGSDPKKQKKSGYTPHPYKADQIKYVAYNGRFLSGALANGSKARLLS